MFDQENPLPWFWCDRDHVVALEKYMILWVKDKMGTECRPLCRKGVSVARAKVAPDADKPNDMTPKDRHNTETTRNQSTQMSLRTATLTIINIASSPAKTKERRQSMTNQRSSNESGSEGV
ncbi:MAG: hypothetical protein ACKPKO_45985 [Candidatus Fonsibacter sp.]